MCDSRFSILAILDMLDISHEELQWSYKRCYRHRVEARR